MHSRQEFVLRCHTPERTGAAQIVRLIRKLTHAGGFEDTLSYVRIPQLSEPDGLPEPVIRANLANESRGSHSASDSKKALVRRDPLISVFDELAVAGVRRILRLQVEDNSDVLAHSDTAIERAIKGPDSRDEPASTSTRTEPLNIETWYFSPSHVSIWTTTRLTMYSRDWRKPDIDLGLIYNVEPKIKTVHLHWSGGQTVLRGWVDAILELYPEFKELTLIHLHAYQVLYSLCFPLPFL